MTLVVKLARSRVRPSMREHNLYITDWRDARDLPLTMGRFDFDDFVDYVIEFLQFLGPNTHVIAVCHQLHSAPAYERIAMCDAHDRGRKGRHLRARADGSCAPRIDRPSHQCERDGPRRITFRRHHRRRREHRNRRLREVRLLRALRLLALRRASSGRRACLSPTNGCPAPDRGMGTAVQGVSALQRSSVGTDIKSRRTLDPG